MAIDFETANPAADSACALCVIRVDREQITQRMTRLIRPPTSWFTFTYVHNLTWDHVANEPEFREVWPAMAPLLEGAAFVAAHNAPFDREVLAACCERTGHPMPTHDFLDTVKLARMAWNLRPTKLPDVCRHLSIPLNHHDASSDAEACARIVLAVIAEGRRAGKGNATESLF